MRLFSANPHFILIFRYCMDSLVNILTTLYAVKHRNCAPMPGRSIGLLDTFAELRKATISSVMCVCPSFHPHGTTRLQLDGFS
jgi:hypothetical protein